MTKFSDQLFDDLMREHGTALAHARPPAQPKRHITARQTLLASGGTLAVGAAVAGVLVAQSGTPAHVAGSRTPAAYAVTKNSDGTITLAVYQKSGIAGANTRLRQLGARRVVVVPVQPGCPRPAAPAVSGRGHLITTGISVTRNGGITVKAQGIPAGDILVIGVQTSVQTSGRTSMSGGILTSPPAPSCISLPAPPAGNGGSGS
jgi:hypothetical protein